MFERDWELAEATIITERLLTHWSRGAGDATVPREYVADVRPQGQPPFRATFHEPLIHGHYDHPRAGQVANVLFNPKTHKVKLSPEYKASPRKLEQEKAENFHAIADAPAGTGSPADPSREAGAERIIEPPASPAAE